MSALDDATLLHALPLGERRLWMWLLAPDDAADMIQPVPEDEREGPLSLLDDITRTEVTAMLAYAEDEAGGLMSPHYFRAVAPASQARSSPQTN